MPPKSMFKKTCFAALLSLAATNTYAACNVEQGYLACHLTSAQGAIVNLSFPEGQAVTTGTHSAALCGGNTSGVSSVSLQLAGLPTYTDSTVSNEDGNGCADLSNLSFAQPGIWHLTLLYKDGDTASVSLDVQP